MHPGGEDERRENHHEGRGHAVEPSAFNEADEVGAHRRWIRVKAASMSVRIGRALSGSPGEGRETEAEGWPRGRVAQLAESVV